LKWGSLRYSRVPSTVFLDTLPSSMMACKDVCVCECVCVRVCVCVCVLQPEEMLKHRSCTHTGFAKRHCAELPTPHSL
jgi:hypothetical protein